MATVSACSGIKLNNYFSSTLQKTPRLLNVKSNTRSRRNQSKSALDVVCRAHSFDVVVVGAGIIGLSIARDLLLRSDLSVAVVDAKVPRSGATGAGQGMIWMASKTPGTGVWDLALRSKKLWQLLADDIEDQGADPLKELGWKKAGSLLVGRTEAELGQLKSRVQQLAAAGIGASYLCKDDLALRIPDLETGPHSGAAFVPDDCQIDAHRASAFIEKSNRLYESQGRYVEFYHDPAVCLIRSDSRGKIEGIKTKNNTLYGRKAVVIAAGCWTGSLMEELLKGSDISLRVPIQPRKGHLLVLEDFNPLKLSHGVMEAGYVDHQHKAICAQVNVDQEALSVAMLASVDASGNLILGSSRQFVGFNTELSVYVADRIWERAQEFFPALRRFSLKNLSSQMNVRIGLRPFMPGSKPVIGPITGMANLILAAGHEGEGLCTSLGTAEMVTDLILDNPLQIGSKLFAVEDRCC